MGDQLLSSVEEEELVFYFRILSRHSPRGTEDTHEITMRIADLQTDMRSQCAYLENRRPMTFCCYLAYRDKQLYFICST
jgi:hypothetical protein